MNITAEEAIRLLRKYFAVEFAKGIATCIESQQRQLLESHKQHLADRGKIDVLSSQLAQAQAEVAVMRGSLEEISRINDVYVDGRNDTEKVKEAIEWANRGLSTTENPALLSSLDRAEKVARDAEEYIDADGSIAPTKLKDSIAEWRKGDV